MTAKLYIGNVSYAASREDLSVLFAEVGTVLASRLIVDQVTGKSRGFGFVEMANEAEAEAAIGRFNGHQLLGRILVVRLAHDNRELNRRTREAKVRQQYDLRQPIMHQSMPFGMRSDPRVQDLHERMGQPARLMPRGRLAQAWDSMHSLKKT